MTAPTFEERVNATRPRAAELLATIQAQRYVYPWEKLDEQFAANLGFKLQLVGYGSLLNAESARRSFPDTPLEGHPAVFAFGARRVFNYPVPDSVSDRYGGAPVDNQRAALNVDYLGTPDALLTGRLLELSASDLPNLRSREKGYHLEPVVYFHWDAYERRDPQIAHVLRADKGGYGGVCYADDTLLPYPPYVDICHQGAKAGDVEFENAFLETSWLADRITTLKQWLAKSK